ncbi:hypothetical protein SLEP1_g14296 [Rubroshorea leprosula]|uniref:Uncharacterized protein n=1 Tax=Rubroshorea leprosula TaxID=152421 RepID=A0AAV5IU58_9ROSI|nr:hypothetical protein SLEP1_g14296 [Rubroshorea leprosula]
MDLVLDSSAYHAGIQAFCLLVDTQCEGRGERHENPESFHELLP